ncbi:hypothetical protein ABZ958_37255 [Streptomyces sp. NPDC046237]|uniref:hypothetical protein n=1 Tax=Streptomyces sp. NPDC046237 TaxID=3154914 RepID=UPI0033DC259A
MLAEALAALAQAGAVAVIGAMATDLWQGARDGVVQLFRRGEAPGEGGVGAGDAGAAGGADAVGNRLDEDAALVAGAEHAEADLVRRELVPLWRRQLTRLLEEHPDSEAELRELVERLRSALPAERQVWLQSNTARDNATLFAVQGGDLHYHHAPDGQLPPTAP